MRTISTDTYAIMVSSLYVGMMGHNDHNRTYTELVGSARLVADSIMGQSDIHLEADRPFVMIPADHHHPMGNWSEEEVRRMSDFEWKVMIEKKKKEESDA